MVVDGLITLRLLIVHPITMIFVGMRLTTMHLSGIRVITIDLTAVLDITHHLHVGQCYSDILFDFVA
jgi:hypothetical protein